MNSQARCGDADRIEDSVGEDKCMKRRRREYEVLRVGKGEKEIIGVRE